MAVRSGGEYSDGHEKQERKGGIAGELGIEVMCGWNGDSRRLAWAGLNGRVGEKLLPTIFRCAPGTEDDDHGVLFRWALQQLGTW